MEENGSEKENIETDMLNTSENSNLDEVIDDTGVRITKVVPGNMNGSSCTFWRKKICISKVGCILASSERESISRFQKFVLTYFSFSINSIKYFPTKTFLACSVELADKSIFFRLAFFSVDLRTQPTKVIMTMLHRSVMIWQLWLQNARKE